MEVREEMWIVAQQSRIALTLSIGVVTQSKEVQANGLTKDEQEQMIRSFGGTIAGRPVVKLDLTDRAWCSVLE